MIRMFSGRGPGVQAEQEEIWTSKKQEGSCTTSYPCVSTCNAPHTLGACKVYRFRISTSVCNINYELLVVVVPHAHNVPTCFDVLGTMLCMVPMMRVAYVHYT